MARKACAWIENFQSHRTTPHWISFLGPCGTGKTHCAKILYNSSGPTDYFATEFFPSLIHWPSFVEDLRRGWRFEELSDMRSWPILAIDDILAERDPTGFATEKLSTLLCARDSKWTIITSNLTLRDIAKTEPRIASRMLRNNGIVVQLDGTQDFNLRKLL